MVNSVKLLLDTDVTLYIRRGREWPINIPWAMVAGATLVQLLERVAQNLYECGAVDGRVSVSLTRVEE